MSDVDLNEDTSLTHLLDRHDKEEDENVETQIIKHSPFYGQTKFADLIRTRCTRGVRVVFSVTRMRSSNSARINKFDFRTEKSCSVHMTVFEIVAGHNVVNWMQLLT